jgi:hypothetical protein
MHKKFRRVSHVMQNEASTLANGNKQIKESIQFMIQHQEMQKGMFSLITSLIQFTVL